tara:strand:- start:18 stop:557 length:540 start_codon:yes stop_codon:yes gene_type:complete
MIQQENLKKEYAKSSMKIDCLTTPGIITQIISKLNFNDQGISSLYLLVNNIHLRYELQPFIDNISKYNHELHLLRIKKKQEKKHERLKSRMIMKIRQYINDFDFSERTSQKIPIILELFDYLENNITHLHLLGKSFGKSLDERIDRFIIDGTRKHLSDFVATMHEKRVIFQDYINWSLD